MRHSNTDFLLITENGVYFGKTFLPSCTYRHFHGFRLSKLCQSMKAHIESLLLSEVKGSKASEWRQDSLFSFCYSLLFRYHFCPLCNDNVPT